MANTHTFTKGEEIANSITHGIGIPLSAAALTLLIVFSSMYGNVEHIVTFSIYGATMLFLYLASTLLHSFPAGKLKDLFEIFDHSSIYFFIAGSYTPFMLIVVKGWVGWTLLAVVWSLAIGGTIFKCFFVKKYLYVSTLLYVLMGWLIVLAWKPLASNLSTGGLTLLVIGGIIYSLGSIFYIWRGFKYHHAVWHMFVIAGSSLHFFCILFYVLPL
ncbi:PAQR family membrane homeostasis protein TrhA [Bacillus toyonensis]|uniref:PAQR family membrane homeostasis protein TrhA n=1 Tax=Bacillus toyonensis TaxID=155322 RepID=UPI002E24D678|nr:hemolysin III family protein [Bacillus toyonensis]